MPITHEKAQEVIQSIEPSEWREFWEHWFQKSPDECASVIEAVERKISGIAQRKHISVKQAAEEFWRQFINNIREELNGYQPQAAPERPGAPEARA